MDLQTFVDVAIGLATLASTVAGLFGAVWLFFRNRIRRWWLPYRTGINGMAEVPSLRRSIEAGRKEISGLAQQVGMMNLMIRARGDINIEAGEFEASAEGAWTYVNQTLARWLGVGKAELLAWGWVNFIHPEDRDGVRREWDQCRTEHRVYNRRCRIVGSDGGVILVDVLATPIPDAPPAKQWVGVIRRAVT
jgi:PAS domain S-box-containing protein